MINPEKQQYLLIKPESEQKNKDLKINGPIKKKLFKNKVKRVGYFLGTAPIVVIVYPIYTIFSICEDAYTEIKNFFYENGYGDFDEFIKTFNSYKNDAIKHNQKEFSIACSTYSRNWYGHYDNFTEEEVFEFLQKNGYKFTKKKTKNNLFGHELDCVYDELVIQLV